MSLWSASPRPCFTPSQLLDGSRKLQILLKAFGGAQGVYRNWGVLIPTCEASSFSGNYISLKKRKTKVCPCCCCQSQPSSSSHRLQCGLQGSLSVVGLHGVLVPLGDGCISTAAVWGSGSRGLIKCLERVLD